MVRQYNRWHGYPWRYSPFYSNRADYNTNSRSYYDYLAKHNIWYTIIEDTVNRLLARDIHFIDSSTVDFVKTGSWLDDENCNYDNVIDITANVKISDKAGNSITDDGTGIYVPPLPSYPTGFTTTFEKAISAVSQYTAGQNSTITLTDSIENYSKVRITFTVGSSQYSTTLATDLLSPTAPDVPTLSGIDFSEASTFMGFTGVQIVNDTSLKVVPGQTLTNQFTHANMTSTLITEGTDVTPATAGACIVTQIFGIKEMTV